MKQRSRVTEASSTKIRSTTFTRINNLYTVEEFRHCVRKSKCMDQCDCEISLFRSRHPHIGTDLLKPHVIFPVSGEYDLSALFADISSMLIGKGILIYPCVLHICY